MKTLRLILGDQLTHSLPSLRNIDVKNDIVMLCETMEEATYVKHHKQKIVFTFSAMRHFADELQKKKFNVYYVKIDDKDNLGSFDTELIKAIKKFNPDRVELTFPGEYRLLKKFLAWQKSSEIEITILEDDRFFCSIDEFKQWAKNKKQLRMENFYHIMRMKHHILMDKNNHPSGGRWNFDKENRKPLQNTVTIPNRKKQKCDPITKNVIATVSKLFANHFGELDTFNWAVTRKEALECLENFIEKILPNFGEYQDAMNESSPFLFHSLLSPYLNAGLLLPNEICKLAEAAYHAGNAPLNSVEGFIRQVLGWREYVRGVYWLKMPEYAELNYFDAKRHLPWFYWSGETNMNCLHTAIKQTSENAYSHHIQRLMVTGNFALLAGIDPKEVCEWYLIVYLDAYDWVELPNTLGMSLYGDGGFLGSKPYAASGKYIQRMSNFCKNCIYDPKETIGEKACPFNSLYWDFLDRNQKLLRYNQRLTYTYATWNKMSVAKRKLILEQAQQFLSGLDKAEKS